MKIVILGGKLESWGGGVDFLNFVIRGLLHRPDHEYTLLLRANPPSFLPRIIVKNSRFFLKRLSRRFPNPNTRPFQDFSSRLRMIGASDPNRALDQLQPDLVIPCADQGITHPFAGYIFDCQHRHLPDLFSPRECDERDRLFTWLVQRSRVLMVNSQATMRDIEELYPPLPPPVSALPFTPLLEESWLAESGDPRNRWNIPDRYFIVCNQFWKHKDHATAFRALAMLDNPDTRDIHLVCTGKTEDYRFPGYFAELRQLLRELRIENRVHFTGHIEKQAQIGLLRRAISVIQPTLCEGGPGGGVAYSARALGVPIILSDIPVNREIPEETGVWFFPAGQADGLAEQMIEAAQSNIPSPPREELIQKNNSRLANLSDALHEILHIGTGAG